MAYDQSKDKLIKLFERKENKGTLMISIMSYNNGDKKIQIGRSYEKKDGSLGYSGMGRLTLSELKWFNEIYDEILKYMNK